MARKITLIEWERGDASLTVRVLEGGKLKVVRQAEFDLMPFPGEYHGEPGGVEVYEVGKFSPPVTVVESITEAVGWVRNLTDEQIPELEGRN